MQEITHLELNQLSVIIQQLTKENYTLSLPILMNNSIGKHVRHILDLFECLIASGETGILNYDSRTRCTETESDKDFALNKIQKISLSIQELDLDKKIALKQNLNDSICEINSTIARELLYNIEHCIHHLAIIRIGIENNFPHVEIPENFGIAHSTLAHREQNLD